ncbi:TraB/GumN family protein [Paraferrimonas sp. SM1919]|uniref:TraB/GumN family protein n=1 Tax=Paraferrimonas sp. SM1919 TaxID=2662263 RepID=UPI0013CF40FF|nr:TraB/GumN family protein [Paraferrimonas sp. SM1919]
MPIKYLSSLLVIVLVALFSSAAVAKSSVWKVSKGGKYFYVGGTIHLLKESDYPLPSEFDKAYKDSDKLIFETDIAASETPAAQQKLMMAMMSKTGQTLQQSLGGETYQKLQAFLASRQLPIENFAALQPWAVGLVVTVTEYQRFGMMPQFGVDKHYSDKAMADGKPIGQLETFDQQVSFLESMGEIEPNLFINYTMEDLTTLPELIKFMKTAWRSGDIEAFTGHEMMTKMEQDFPLLQKVLIVDRNNNWMKQLVTLNNNDITEFVVVGTLHLNGEHGVLNQLIQAGFKVSQL